MAGRRQDKYVMDSSLRQVPPLYDSRRFPPGTRRPEDIEMAVDARRSADLYYDERRSNIDRGRGSQKSRGSVRSRGSYGSSPRPLEPKPLEARIKHCCRVSIAFIFSNVGVCGLFVGYTIMGSFLFQVNNNSYRNYY